MKKYQELGFELIFISTQDVVTVSPGAYDANQFDDVTNDDVFFE